MANFKSLQNLNDFFNWIGVDVPLTLMLTFPIIVLAFRLRDKRKTPTGSYIAKSPASLFPYFLALVFVTWFTQFVYFKLATTVITFYDSIMRGWTYEECFLILFSCAGVAACAMVIWSSNNYNRNVDKQALDRLWVAEMFYAGRSEMVRFGVFFFSALFCWAAAVEAVRFFIHNWPFDLLVMAMARVAIPLMVLLIGAVIRLPILPVAALVAVGIYLWAARTIGYGLGALFVAVPLALLVAALLFRYISVGEYLPRIATPDAENTSGTKDK